jgi:arsenate reductase
MFTIYHNPRCKKSRAGLQFLQENGFEFTIVDYIKNPVGTEELEQVFARLNKKPSEMIRKQETLFKSDYKGKNFTEEEWIRIFAAHPKLMHRPIVVAKHKAVWADPAISINELL